MGISSKKLKSYIVQRVNIQKHCIEIMKVSFLVILTVAAFVAASDPPPLPQPSSLHGSKEAPQEGVKNSQNGVLCSDLPPGNPNGVSCIGLGGGNEDKCTQDSDCDNGEPGQVGKCLDFVQECAYM